MRELDINLPYFCGFYGSNLDLSEELYSLQENDIISEDELDNISYEDLQHEVGELYFDGFIEQVGHVLQDYGLELTYKGIDSPRFYNYSNDKLVCTVEFDPDYFVDLALNFVHDNFTDFSSFLKDAYTSRSGFISFYSNDIYYWIENLINEDMDNVVMETLIACIVSEELDTWEIESMILSNFIEIVFNVLNS